MHLTLFVLKYVSILHWIVSLYYYGHQVYKGTDLILVIQTFCLCVLYMSIRPPLLYDPYLMLQNTIILFLYRLLSYMNITLE